MYDKMIKLWYHSDAPKDILQVVDNQDDMDYIALVPNGIDIPFFLDNSDFGCCAVGHYKHPAGIVLVGYHS
jgi:hypothetical protein